jgi:hypothetical protein
MAEGQANRIGSLQPHAVRIERPLQVTSAYETEGVPQTPQEIPERPIQSRSRLRPCRITFKGLRTGRRLNNN